MSSGDISAPTSCTNQKRGSVLGANSNMTEF